jgi:hypothetical protein
MGLSTDESVANFPNKTLPTIADEPDYGSINNMVQLLYDNAAAFPTTLGGGQHGHTGLIMTPLLYPTLSPVPYKQTIDPVATAPSQQRNCSPP